MSKQLERAVRGGWCFLADDDSRQTTELIISRRKDEMKETEKATVTELIDIFQRLNKKNQQALITCAQTIILIDNMRNESDTE